jgi:hypothetical protein
MKKECTDFNFFVIRESFSFDTWRSLYSIYTKQQEYNTVQVFLGKKVGILSPTGSRIMRTPVYILNKKIYNDLLTVRSNYVLHIQNIRAQIRLALPQQPSSMQTQSS